jgi:methylenetetrahydrofolate dehydrogenase (NADP+)/methenyltetrahydrofolate cyclohydrolase
LVNPLKDVDGFHHENQWKMLIWDKTCFLPCTPFGILELIKYYQIELVGKNVVVIWRSNIVWKPIANLLIQAWSTVTVCHTQTKDIVSYTKQADIIILCAGSPKLLNSKQIWKKTLIIDVGFTIVDGKIYWDADFEDIIQQWNDITPVPWWIGPLTVACLLKNTLQAFLQNQN